MERKLTAITLGLSVALASACVELDDESLDDELVGISSEAISVDDGESEGKSNCDPPNFDWKADTLWCEYKCADDIPEEGPPYLPEPTREPLNGWQEQPHYNWPPEYGQAARKWNLVHEHCEDTCIQACRRGGVIEPALCETSSVWRRPTGLKGYTVKTVMEIQECQEPEAGSLFDESVK